MAADEDVRVRQLRGLGNLYMLALCPEDTPFTLPELQKRSQQEANKRQSFYFFIFLFLVLFFATIKR
ncbi:uncharacterized protein ACA1_151390 [Acanthamoeba castellanii str. Neff]|uniref:Uncharacterized protein n=1 Tax=Acanthamoeba castellanii (strain ATCC 30010 / Neff) TaxID=1257118 RepID=L8H327_ACACF|nr:uncharacterized protein ACA1_151390 [Acanthamoeba castellanii str. Neff]ELR18826.1 hypothetical protein ACA1_151390 [Acanthamoeba castellanii str. Neff]